MLDVLFLLALVALASSLLIAHLSDRRFGGRTR